MSRPLGVAFVTGATGFVGRWLVPTLAARGFEVHAIARPLADRSVVGPTEVHWHPGDVTDPASLRAAVAAAAGRGTPRVAVHAAATISYARGAGALQERVNVDGTRHALEAFEAAGFERRVHVGSVVAVGVAPHATAVLDEDAPWDPTLEWVDYVRTKRRADELALERGAIVVDPGAIFGPGAPHSNTTRFTERIRRSGAPPIVPPGGLAVVDVRDVAEGIALAAERGRAGRRYLLVESNHSLRDLFGLGAELARKRGPRGVVPRGAWLALVRGAGWVERVVPLGALGAQGLRLLAESYRFDARRARTELGWNPRPFRSSLEETLNWLAARA
ncbi:MAG: NAD-dependent epimerase/dehydratase family protein [Planctomycetota bacterium]